MSATSNARVTSRRTPRPISPPSIRLALSAIPSTAAGGDRTATDELLRKWAMWQRAQGNSERTIEARADRVHSLEKVTGCQGHGATEDDIIAYMARPRSPGTRATYYSHLRAWFVWLVKMGHRDDDPTMRVPSPRVPRRQPRPITRGQLEALVATRMHKRTRMMVLLAAFQGLRVHEIAKLRGEDVDLYGRQLRVLGKGGTDVMLPLSPIVEAEAHVSGFPRKGYWFPTHVLGNTLEVDHVLPRSVSEIISQAMDRANITGGAHRLRHRYATGLLESGVNLRVVQTLMRHASLQTTQIYTDVNADQQRAAIDGLGF